MKHRTVIYWIIAVCAAAIVFYLSCNSYRTKPATAAVSAYEAYSKVSPDFDADSAYAFIERQVSFGPRVPDTPEHSACGDYLSATLKAFGAEVTEQTADIVHYNGEMFSIRNIIGSFQPEKEKRIMLFAHWDTRPFADRETDPQKQRQPIAGADDGASGVGVLLEIARQLQQKPAAVGVDLFFFDLEDWGHPEFEASSVSGDWWCVGSRYWSENPHRSDYRAAYGILLDMVGGKGAAFPREGYSVQYASNVVEKVWSTATKLGYGSYFIQKNGSYITDDHVPVNKIRHIPCVDIIHLQDSPTGFAPHWHTHADNLSVIDRATLKAAGQTVMEVIYAEND